MIDKSSKLEQAEQKPKMTPHQLAAALASTARHGTGTQEFLGLLEEAGGVQSGEGKKGVPMGRPKALPGSGTRLG